MPIASARPTPIGKATAIPAISIATTSRILDPVLSLERSHAFILPPLAAETPQPPHPSPLPRQMDLEPNIKNQVPLFRRNWGGQCCRSLAE